MNKNVYVNYMYVNLNYSEINKLKTKEKPIWWFVFNGVKAMLVSVNKINIKKKIVKEKFLQFYK